MSESVSTQNLLDKTPVYSLVLKLGIPAMLGQFFNILYSIVDRIFVGHIAGTGEISLAGIGICAPALTAVSAFAYMIGIGGAASMSISLGEKNHQRAKDILGNAVFLTLIVSAAVTALLLFIREPLLYLLGCSRAMYPYAETYFTIYICGTVVSLLGVALNQFLMAQGFARQGMISVVIGAVVNLILDPVLIFVCNMGVAGAAAATVIAQFLMAAYVVYQLSKEEVPIRFRICKPQKALCNRILSIGSMSFLITILDNLIIILLNIVIRKYGGDILGDRLIICATVVQSFLTIVFCPAQGVTTGCGTIFSYNYGAKRYKKIRQAFIGVFLLCGLYIGILQIAVQIFPGVFASLFLQNGDLITQASACLRMYTLALVGVAVQYALVDGLTAMGKIKFAFPLSIFRKLVYIVCLFVIPMVSDIRHVFYAGAISDLIGATFSIVVFLAVLNPKLEKELK